MRQEPDTLRIRAHVLSDLLSESTTQVDEDKDNVLHNAYPAGLWLCIEYYWLKIQNRFESKLHIKW